MGRTELQLTAGDMEVWARKERPWGPAGGGGRCRLRPSAVTPAGPRQSGCRAQRLAAWADFVYIRVADTGPSPGGTRGTPASAVLRRPRRGPVLGAPCPRHARAWFGARKGDYKAWCQWPFDLFKIVRRV